MGVRGCLVWGVWSGRDGFGVVGIVFVGIVFVGIVFWGMGCGDGFVGMGCGDVFGGMFFLRGSRWEIVGNRHICMCVWSL